MWWLSLRPDCSRRGGNSLMVQQHSFFRMYIADGRIGGRTPMLVAEKYQRRRTPSRKPQTYRLWNSSSQPTARGSQLWVSTTSRVRRQRRMGNCYSFPVCLQDLWARFSHWEISTPRRLNRFVRQSWKLILGIKSYSSCTRVGWLNTLLK